MSSKKKINKLKNSYQHKTALKDKGKGVKGISFYTSSQRRANKKIE